MINCSQSTDQLLGNTGLKINGENGLDELDYSEVLLMLVLVKKVFRTDLTLALQSSKIKRSAQRKESKVIKRFSKTYVKYFYKLTVNTVCHLEQMGQRVIFARREIQMLARSFSGTSTIQQFSNCRVYQGPPRSLLKI